MRLQGETVRASDAAGRTAVPFRFFLTCATVAWLATACSREPGGAASSRSADADLAPMSFAAQNALISDYCVKCHNYEDYAGGLELLVFQAEHAAEDPETAERVIRKLRAGMMPPAGEPRPDFATGQAMAASLEAAIDASADYRPAWRGLHRLNRTEYANVVRDLVGLELDASALLPVDDSADGFDNQASALSLSPVLLEAYLTAAAKVAEIVVGDAVTPTQTLYRVAEDASQNGHVEGLPFGTRGGILIDHYFPANGDYAFKVFAVNVGNMGNFRPFGEVRGEQLEILIDGERVGLFDWDKELGVGGGFGDDDEYRGRLRTIDLTVPVTAGPHAVGVTFLASNYAPSLDLNDAFERTTIETGGLPGFTFYPHVGRVRIDGPANPTGPGPTPSRARIFSCEPARAADEPACAEAIIAAFARRAYRGDVTEADLDALRRFYAEGRRAGDFDDGIEAALQRALSDPKFIYRVETPPLEVAAGEPYRLSELELASRLSFFLWSSMPDEELLSLAEQGRLRDAGVLEAQVARLLADPRSISLSENFAGQWLALRNLDGHAPVVAEFPDFDDNLRQAFRQETELFFDSLVREDAPVFDLLTADYTFVNERLARHYGIPGVRGSRFRRIELGEAFAERRGLLGKGSLLTVTSQPGRTSPVIRGNWVLGNLIGVPAPPPPPDVPEIEPPPFDAAGNVRIPTIREQYEAHRVNPACSGCHMMMDPIGFALEPFDATGRLREQDGGAAINASDVMYDGEPIDGPADLRDFVLRYREQYLRNVAERLMTYAVGRAMTYEDMPVVRAVVRAAAEDGYRFQSLILAVARSDAFQMSTRPTDEGAAGDGAVRAAAAGAG
jgi:hypothetical protein